MKKKNIFAIVLAMALVAVVAVGATLAYLTANSEQVTNKFTFADGMTVTLEEPTPTPKVQETATPNGDGGYDYSNIVPGQALDKRPTLTATTPVDSYVFAYVSGATKDAWIEKITDSDKDDTNDWIAVDGTTDSYNNGLYYKTAPGSNDGTAVTTVLGTVFNTVQTSKDATKDTDVSDIMVKAFEIQKNGITLEDAIKEAKTYFGISTPASGSDPVVEPAA